MVRFQTHRLPWKLRNLDVSRAVLVECLCSGLLESGGALDVKRLALAMRV
jgi:hypothetical protein